MNTYLAEVLTMARVALDAQHEAIRTNNFEAAMHAGLHHQNAGAVAALLVVLHQLSPATADQIAARLLVMQEAGQALGEQWLEWQGQIAEGLPLTPFATALELAVLRGGAR
ncbi:hypothetical protein N8J89_07815 [Crossiella sp. CA-258035]|uniref:hypothetical protein n=1 Tax=Crossiella sp. CA-258035 TaxID=2981138 RepID=UPI0024BD5B60|nr:hypothetical protein [Crossiella sp. CA-258035]WHT20960.1 hypothetical protein N8J89_07815 [Crossiella sp. CA-258035]